MDLLVKWSPTFSQNKYNIGLTQAEYVIQLNKNVPVKSYTPQNSPPVEKAIGDELDKLEKVDFIEPLFSPYSAPTVCVAKPDGTLRVTIDFQMVNKNIVNDAYSMHWVEDQLEAMSGAMVFTTLDMTKGYHQMN